MSPEEVPGLGGSISELLPNGDDVSELGIVEGQINSLDITREVVEDFSYVLFITNFSYGISTTL